MKLPKKIIKMYRIQYRKDMISFHHPAYVGVYKDDSFTIEERPLVYEISNSKCSVSLWKKVEVMHVVVFR